MQLVVDFFNGRLDAMKSNAAAGPESQADWSVAKVLSLINNFAQVTSMGVDVELMFSRGGRVHAF
jgi:hypothetical protein